MIAPPSRREVWAAALLSIPLALLFTWTQVLPLDGIPVMGTDYGQLVWNMWSVDRAISSGQSPLHSDLVFHPIGTSLEAHVLTPAFFPMIAYKIAIGVCHVIIAFSIYAFLRRIGAAVVSVVQSRANLPR